MWRLSVALLMLESCKQFDSPAKHRLNVLLSVERISQHLARIGGSFQAVIVMEDYVRTQLKPHGHPLLAEFYENCNEPAKAQAACAQGIAEREPQSVDRHVWYV
jgi:hypothetical protein